MTLPLRPPGVLETQRLRINHLLSKILRSVVGYQQHQVVICGFPRSGTSLLLNMMASSLPSFRHDTFESYVIHRIHRIGDFITKAPMDVFNVRHLDRLNGNVKRLAIIVMIRDVRDVITSRHPLLPDEYFIGHDHSWWPQDRHFKQWRFDAPGVMAIFDEIERIRNRADVALVRYEDLVLDADVVQESLGVRFSLPFNGRFSEYHLSSVEPAYRYEGRFLAKDKSLVQEGSPVNDTRVARWRRQPELWSRVREQFMACDRLFEVLATYGYESSRDWIDE